MSSAQDIDVLEHEPPQDAEEDPSAIPKPESDSSAILTLMSKMQLQLNENSRILHSLLNEEAGDGAHHLSARRRKVDVEPTVASMNALSSASQNANIDAAQTVNFGPAQTGILPTAQSVSTFTIDILVNRPSKVDVISLFGGQAFDPNPQEVENEALLDGIGTALMPQAQQGPSISTQFAKIINGKFTTEFDLSNRKEILEKYPPPSNCDSLSNPKGKP